MYIIAAIVAEVLVCIALICYMEHQHRLDLAHQEHLLDLANDRIRDIHATLYGQGFEVLGWHGNGQTEPLDNWFEENDWEPVEGSDYY